jgi:hypothetical protein
MADRERVTIRQDINDAYPLQFDAVITETHTQRLTVTENPIETGVSIADHCYLEPAQLSIVGSVADVKMPSAASGYDNLAMGRSNFAWLRLVELERQLALNEMQPFEIITSVKTYTNMVMTDITMARDRTSTLIGRFTMSFREIITVQLLTVPYTKFRQGGTRRAAAPKVDNGNQQPEKPDEQQTKELNRSVAWAGAGKMITGIFGGT